MLPAGSRIAGYRIERLLGSGAMGEVYLGRQLSLNRPVAIKAIAPRVMERPDAVARFAREAQVIARVNSPYVVAVHDFLTETASDGGELHLLIMELVEGGCCLADVMDESPVDWRLATSCIRQAADGLAAAVQAGIVHRDIKPHNIMLTPGGIAKLADFGLARAGDSTAMTAEGAMLGTPLYMSPEACRGEEVDHRGDLYSLGATWYHLLAGRPPFVAPTAMGVLRAHCDDLPTPIGDLRTDLPGVIARLVMDCLAKDPDLRPRDAAELSRAIAAASDDGIHIPADARELVPTAVRAAAGNSTIDTSLAADRGTAATLVHDPSTGTQAGATLPTAVDPAAGPTPEAGESLAGRTRYDEEHDASRAASADKGRGTLWVALLLLLGLAGVSAWWFLAPSGGTTATDTAARVGPAPSVDESAVVDQSPIEADFESADPIATDADEQVEQQPPDELEQSQFSSGLQQVAGSGEKGAGQTTDTVRAGLVDPVRPKGSDGDDSAQAAGNGHEDAGSLESDDVPVGHTDTHTAVSPQDESDAADPAPAGPPSTNESAARTATDANASQDPLPGATPGERIEAVIAAMQKGDLIRAHDIGESMPERLPMALETKRRRAISQWRRQARSAFVDQIRTSREEHQAGNQERAEELLQSARPLAERGAFMEDWHRARETLGIPHAAEANP